MGFFEAPEVTEEDTDEFEPPAWNAPPRRVLGRVVPLSIFVAQSDQVVIALTYATAYPTGCLLALEISGRRGEMDPREWWGIGQNTLHRPFGMNNLLGELPDGL